MKLRVLFFMLVAMAAQTLYAQGEFKTFDVCASKDTIKKVIKGDTVVINCNEAYLLNQNVLTNYRRSLQNNRNCTEVIKTYATLSNTQDSVISQQNRRFNELQSKFDSLGNNTGRFLTVTQGSLNQLSDTLGNVSKTIMQTQSLLSETKILLENEKKNKWKDRLRWGLGGIGVGFVTTSLVFLLVR